MEIEVQNMDLNYWKISSEVQKLTFEDWFKTKITLRIFWNIPGSFRLDFISKFYDFKGKSTKLKENQEKKNDIFI